MLNAAVQQFADVNPDHGMAERVQLNLQGRLMMPSRAEHACKVLEMSGVSAAVYTDALTRPGDRIVAYMNHIGRIEGYVTRLFDGGFALQLIISERKREKLEAQLKWLGNRHQKLAPEDRRHERFEPVNPASVVTLSDGRQYRCRIIDLSLSGAAIAMAVRPAIGTQLTLGGMQGQVVRHFEEGVAIEFAFVPQRDGLAAVQG